MLPGSPRSSPGSYSKSADFNIYLLLLPIKKIKYDFLVQKGHEYLLFRPKKIQIVTFQNNFTQFTTFLFKKDVNPYFFVRKYANSYFFVRKRHKYLLFCTMSFLNTSSAILCNFKFTRLSITCKIQSARLPIPGHNQLNEGVVSSKI